MLRTLFSFGGQIDRRAFMLGNLAIFGAIVGLTIVIVVGALMAGAPATPGKIPPGFVLAFAVMGLAACWPSLALYLKRFRDLGVGVLPGLAVVLVPSVIGNLAAFLHMSLVAKLGVQGLASLVNLGVFIACCALKGRTGPPAAPLREPEPRADLGRPQRFSPTVAPRAQFGLRGL